MESCSQLKPSDKCLKSLNMFPLSKPLKVFAIDINRPLLRTMEGNTFIVIITDCFKKRTRVIQGTKTAKLRVIRVVLENWIMPYDILDIILTDNGKYFTPKFFAAYLHLSLVIGHYDRVSFAE